MDILEDIRPLLESKNPQVKEGTLKFLNRCLSTSKSPPQSTQIKPLSESLANLLEDSFEGARNEAATGLGTLMKIVGERPLNPIMEPMAEVRKVKVKEAFEKATVRCKSGTTTKKPPPVSTDVENNVVKKASKATHALSPTPTSVETNSKKSVEDSKPNPKGPPARLLAKKKESSQSEPSKSTTTAAMKKTAVPQQAASKASKIQKPPPPSELDSFKFCHNPEEAETLATELIPSQVTTDFGNANWKFRLAALEELFTWTSDNVFELDSEVIFRYFAKRGWSEKNFQVSFLSKKVLFVEGK